MTGIHFVTSQTDEHHFIGSWADFPQHLTLKEKKKKQRYNIVSGHWVVPSLIKCCTFFPKSAHHENYVFWSFGSALLYCNCLWGDFKIVQAA